MLDRQFKTCAQPVGQHPGLIEAALAQPLFGQGHRQQAIRTWQAVVEGMLQVFGQQFGEQPPIRPA